MTHVKLSEIPCFQPRSFPIISCQAGGVGTEEERAGTGSMATGAFLLQGNSLLAICKHNPIPCTNWKMKSDEREKAGDERQHLGPLCKLLLSCTGLACSHTLPDL